MAKRTLKYGFFDATGNNDVILGVNKNRVGLIIRSDLDVSCVLKFGESVLNTGDGGIPIGTSIATVLDRDFIGDDIVKAVNAVSFGPPNRWTFTEISEHK
jgi:hypothetical protein